MSLFDPRKDLITDPLYVVTAISNPIRYQRRWGLYEPFAKHMEDSGAILYTAELAYGDRAHVVTKPDNPRHLQFRTHHELWHKENLLNLAIQRLPSDWKYVAWIDADVHFARPDWVAETVHQLQHYSVVQLFSESNDLSPAWEPFMRHESFCKTFHSLGCVGGPSLSSRGYYGVDKQRPGVITWHPGFAWAIRREAFDAVGGLLETALLGAADNHMAKAMVGDAENSCHQNVTQAYRATVMAWQERALKYIRRNIGYVSGLILHGWHGKKKDRRYWDRWKIIVDNQFDPIKDLKKDWQGIWQLVDDGSPRSLALRNDVRGYFRSRNEDSIDLDADEQRM